VTRIISINRAPVLTLSAAVVAERLGFDHEEALTLGRAVAGLNAYAKAVRLGFFTPSPPEVRETRKKLRPTETIVVDLLHRAVPAVRTKDEQRALAHEKPIDPASVERYLESKFGDGLEDAEDAMRALAQSRPPAKIAGEAYSLYENFRPAVPAGTRGWGCERDTRPGVDTKSREVARTNIGYAYGRAESTAGRVTTRSSRLGKPRL
jgi:hypothetical protein